jgi:hypothetical protein
MTLETRSPVTWTELLEHCSRLHTTRRRPSGPRGTGELREDSAMLDVFLPDGTPATVVPTRMHEPGFYVRNRNGSLGGYWLLRSDAALAEFQRWVETGQVLQ